MSAYFKLGLFTIIGIAAIIGSIIAVGDFSLSQDRKFYVLLDDATGLTKKAKISVAGVDTGFLQSITLEGSKAKLMLAITDKNVKIYKNAKVSILSTGIIGVKFLSINPGDASYPLAEEYDYLTAVSGDSISDMIDKLSKALDSDTAGNIFENLAQTVSNLKEITENLKHQNNEINGIIRNASVFTANLAQIASENRNDLREAVTKFKDISDKLDLIASQIYSGDNLVGALLSDPETGNNLKETIASAKETMQTIQQAVDAIGGLEMQWNYTGFFDTKESEYRNDLGIKILPTPNKFYYVGISNIGSTDNTDEDDGEEKKRAVPLNTIDALLGFRQGKFEVYAGIMRSQGGVGAGYSIFEPMSAKRKTLQVHLNAYNFGRKKNGTVIDGDLRVGILKWLYAGVMVEDAMYRNALTPYIKLEIDDKDLGRLFGIASVAAAASR
ncbi:MAG: MlaD family protein [Elusimicrobiota bacterium]|jgi:phospholipid/cholesterol/gamma-HCH transport system substrate-binding protein|nr:MlaD family protein [Elusimicrobiota bacterium]